MSIFRYGYNEYKSVIFFGLTLALLVGCSCYLSRFIPEDIYYSFIAPLQTGCLVALCAFGSFALFRHHDDMRVRKLSSGTLLLWAALLFILLIRITYPYNHMYVTGSGIQLRGVEMVIGDLFAWMLLVYPTELLRPNWLNLKRVLLQIVPIFLIGVIDYVLPVDLRWLLGLYPVVLLSILFIHAHAYRVWCEENYSSMKDIDVQWILKYLTMVLISGGSFYYICFSFSPTRAFTQQWLLFFLIAYSTEQILFRPDPWKDIQKEDLPDDALQTAVPTASSTPYRQILEKWMEEEKPYRKADLRLDDLRQKLPLNKTYLSQMINREFGCNFYHLITHYRVKEAKRLIRENPTMQLQEVAEQCGFSSPTVFGRIFTRETGMTPREWSAKNRLSVN